MILLDTNVISEYLRERPDAVVSAWLDSHPEEDLWTTSIVLAELLSGVEMMTPGRKQKALRDAVENMIAEDFRGQVLNLQPARGASIRSDSRRTKKNRPPNSRDGCADRRHCACPRGRPWQIEM